MVPGDKRRHRLWPIVTDRMRVTDGLVRQLTKLGLEETTEGAEPSRTTCVSALRARPTGGTPPSRRRLVIVVCSWCLAQDRPGLQREIPPFKDRGISDGICGPHLAEWREQLKRHAAAEAGAAGSP